MSLRTRASGLLAALAMSGIIVSGCSTQAPTPAPASGSGGQQAADPSKPAEPKRGGTITVNYASAWNADPAIGQTPYTTWYYVGSPMLKRDIETFELQPALIESWKVAPDGKEVILNVRKGVKFHNKPPINGRELEAKDIVYTLKSATGLQYPDQPPIRFPRKSAFEAMKEAVAVDKYTVKLTLSEPSVSFMHALADYRGAWVTPDGLREAFPGGLESLVTSDPTRHIGTGPFILTKYVSQVEQVSERNPDYWEPGKPYADRVRVITLADRSTELSALVSGQIDVLSSIQESDKQFMANSNAKLVHHLYAPNSCWYRIAFNMTRKPFDDYRVRRAIALMVDQKKIGENVVGFVDNKPVWKYAGPLPWVFPEATPQEELAKHQLFQGATPENVAEARRLLQEAGYDKGLAFDIITSRTYQDEAIIIQADVEKNLPGVKFNVKVMDQEAHRALAAKGDYDAQYYCHIHEVTASAQLKSAYHTTGGRNYPRFSDAKMDDLIDRAEQEFDLQKRTALLRQAEQRVFETISFWPTRHGQQQVVTQPWLKGVRFGAATDYQMNLASLWIDK